MKVDVLNLQTIFAKPVRYEIPRFQRRYVWEREQQWEPLWEDVRNTAERCLEDPSFNAPHFLGAVVLQQQPQPVGMLETRLVVDGQQRLTTMQLLLDAVQEVFASSGDSSSAAQLSVLVLNPESFHSDDPSRKFKVLPTVDDREAFRHAMSNDLLGSEFQESLIVRAHEYFKREIHEWLTVHSEKERGLAIMALHRVVANMLEMVVIDLDVRDSPHIIFETLNARGTPLLQSDLVKNMMLYEAGQSGVEAEDEIWGLSNDWWATEIRQGRLLRPRVDAFLNYWLNLKTQEEVVANEVFASFRRYFESSGETVEEIASDLSRVGQVYLEIEDNRRPDIAEFLYRWKTIGAGVVTPVLLLLLSSEVPEEQMKKSIRALESYLVRRMMCRMTTMGQNRFFISLIQRLARDDVSRAGDVIVQHLAEQQSSVSLWPDDNRIVNTFLSQQFYGLLAQMRIRLVLEGIEGRLRMEQNAESESVPRNLTIEHIMPRAWGQKWSLSASVQDDSQAAMDRDYLVNTIGNLTLVNQSLNSTLSNDPWDKKKRTLYAHTTLFLNKDVVEEMEWNEERIESRARQLADVAIRAWPHAANIK